MDYQTIILESPDDVPTPPAANRLAISGLSVINYCAHRVDPVALTEAITVGRLSEFADDRSYAEKVRPGAGFVYSTLVDGGPFPLSLGRQLHCVHAPHLRQSVVSFGEEYVLSATPIVISSDSNDPNAVQLSSALSTDQLINFLALLASGVEAASLANQAAHALAADGIFRDENIHETWPILGNFGIQIWNLDGTDGRNTDELYQGSQESIRYAWEIAAILSYNSEHLLESGLWLKRSRQQIFSQVRAGFGFFQDHMVFVNADCCLEMSHLPAWLRSNSQFRLSNYGYDSSSVYLWTAGMLQKAIVEDLGGRYQRLTADLGERTGMGAAEHAALMQAQLKHLGLVDRLIGFRGYLVEARSRSFDEFQALERSLDRAVLLLRREIEKAGTLADGLLKVREEASQSRRDAALATIGVALGASQIPGFVAQMQSWVAGQEWIPLVVSSVMIISALLVVPWIWHRRSRGE